MRKKIIILEIVGFLFTVLFGSFLHFAYAISDYYKPLALIAAVNESTWEHLKLAFWPAFLFAIIEFYVFGSKNKNFLFAKLISLYSMPILIIFFFYSYLLFIKGNLFIDIFIFIISVFLGYFIGYKILVSKKSFGKLKWIAIILILLEIFAFSLLTYFSFHSFLFKDPITSFYGIIK